MATLAMATVQSVDVSAVEMARIIGLAGLGPQVEVLDDDEESATARSPARPRRARRLQNAIRDIIREHYLCFVLVWLLFVLALAIATFVTFIELLVRNVRSVHSICFRVFALEDFSQTPPVVAPLHLDCVSEAPQRPLRRAARRLRLDQHRHLR
jgi:hypothetical protein